MCHETISNMLRESYCSNMKEVIVLIQSEKTKNTLYIGLLLYVTVNVVNILVKY